MSVSYIILEIIWRITEIFFILSLFLLGFLFIVKKILDIKKKFIQRKQLQYMYHYLDKNIDFSNDVELISYSQVIGMRLLSTTEHAKREKIKVHIKELQLFEKLYKLYENTYMYRTKLYIFSSLVLFSDTQGRVLFHSVINNMKKRKEMPEFIVLALFGLALSTEKKEHLVELYEILEQIDEEEYPTQKFSEFFFIQAFISLEEGEIIHFLKEFRPKKLTFVSYGLVYALQPLPANLKIYHALLQLHNIYKDDSSLLVAIIRTQYTWKIKDDRLILKYYQHHHDLIRIVCAKIGLDIIDRSNFHLLSHYMCDENSYVRKNFLIALSEHNISQTTIMDWIKNTYPSCMEDPLLKRSLLLYKKGVS
jgi:hypothetical protein